MSLLNNNKGSALVVSIGAILVLGIILAAATGLSLSSFNRAVVSEHKSQAYYTAKSTMDIFVDLLTNKEPESDSLQELKTLIKEEINSTGEFETSISFGGYMGDCTIKGVYKSVAGSTGDIGDIIGTITLTATAEKYGQPYSISFVIEDRVVEGDGWEEIQEEVRIPKDKVSLNTGDAGQLRAFEPNVTQYIISASKTFNGWGYIGHEGTTNATEIVIYVGTEGNPVTLDFGNCNNLGIYAKSVYLILAPGSSVNFKSNNAWTTADVFVLNLDPQNPGKITGGNINRPIVKLPETLRPVYVNGVNGIVDYYEYRTGTDSEGNPVYEKYTLASKTVIKHMYTGNGTAAYPDYNHRRDISTTNFDFDPFVYEETEEYIVVGKIQVTVPVQSFRAAGYERWN